MTRHILLGLIVFPLLVLALLALAGCVLPHMAPIRVVHGTITKIQERWEYEPQCGDIHLTPEAKECATLDLRAWEARLTDSTGHNNYFMYFTANGAPGLPPQLGWTATFTLHARPVFELLTCSNVYQSGRCSYQMEYTLDSLKDVAW